MSKLRQFDCAGNPIADEQQRLSKDVLREASKYECTGAEVPEEPKLSKHVPKGTLTLRSDRHYYRDGVLYHKWSNEDKPKDYNYKTACPKSLHKSTYIRLGSYPDPTPMSVYGITNEDMLLNKSHPPPTIRHRDVYKSDDRTYLMIEREKEVAFEIGRKYLLPHIREDPRKFRSFTTHIDFYRPPFPHIYTTEKHVENEGLKELEEERTTIFNTSCFKKCISQFTDLNGMKICGVQTWFDESGIYANSALRQMHPYFIPKQVPYATRLV